MRDSVNNSCASITSHISFGWPVASDCQGKVSFRQAFVFVLRFHITYFWWEEPVACATEDFRTEKISSIFSEKLSRDEKRDSLKQLCLRGWSRCCILTVFTAQVHRSPTLYKLWNSTEAPVTDGNAYHAANCVEECCLKCGSKSSVFLYNMEYSLQNKQQSKLKSLIIICWECNTQNLRKICECVGVFGQIWLTVLVLIRQILIQIWLISDWSTEVHNITFFSNCKTIYSNYVTITTRKKNTNMEISDV